MKFKIGNLKLEIIKYWPVLGLLALNVVLFALNFKPGTFLIGWDNLMPELSIWTNIQRSLFAVWQEYQSLGLLGGMGHASDLVRQIYVLVLMFVFPMNLARYISTFTMLFLGGVGAYFLIKHLFKNGQPRFAQGARGQWISFIGALFYTLNIGTLQTFYAPFEAFTAHFAALPWFLLSSILYLEKPSRKRLAFLVVILLLAAPSAYIPTLFVVLMIALSIYVFVNFLFESNRVSFLTRAAKLYLIIFLVNAFWLLPFFYFTVTNSGVALTAKINQMSSGVIFAQNKEFGTLPDTALLKGFWFNNVDPNINGNNTFMLAPWKAHFSNPIIPAAGFLLFGIILVGFIHSLLKMRTKNYEQRTKIAYAAIFLFAFTMLATGTQPFALFDQAFRFLPLLGEAFRFPFTKFSLLAALAYSIMLSLGTSFILDFLISIIKTHNSKLKKTINYFLLSIPCLLILLIALPAFNGNLFYNKVTVKIPNEYFETFDYFKHQNQNARIANLPQNTFWGWTFYRWGDQGSGGSGFIWYGLNQPVLDRAFDVWSQDSESYYYQLSAALYSNNYKALEDVINKYQISFVMLDENVIYPPAPHSLFYPETENLLSRIPGAKLDATFGKIKIYKIALKDKPNSFVFTAPANISNVNSPTWKTNDPAYSTMGNYVSKPNNYSLLTNNYLYPFSLFSQKMLDRTQYSLKNNPTNIALQTNINLQKDSNLVVPNFQEVEKIVSASFYKNVDENGNIQINARIQTPQILIDGKKVWGNETTIPLFSISNTATFPAVININGTTNITISDNLPSSKTIGTTFLLMSLDNQIVLSGEDVASQATISSSDYENLFTQGSEIKIGAGTHVISVIIPKIDDSYLSYKAKGVDGRFENCNSFRSGAANTSFVNGVANISDKNSSKCLSFYSATLSHDQGYALFVNSQNLSGRPLHFWVLNEDEKVAPVDIYLDGHGAQALSVPTMESGGLGYSFHLDNSAIGNDLVQNEFSSLEVYPIPSKFIENISFQSGNNNNSGSTIAQIKNVSHPNESLYIVNLKANSSKLQANLVLSQSYDHGWKAYYVTNSNFLNQFFPFIFGKEVKQHFEVNSWENGWLISNEQSIVIAYLPQYLEYIGFGLLFIVIITIVIKALNIKIKRIN